MQGRKKDKNKQRFLWFFTFVIELFTFNFLTSSFYDDEIKYFIIKQEITKKILAFEQHFQRKTLLLNVWLQNWNIYCFLFYCLFLFVGKAFWFLLNLLVGKVFGVWITK